MWFIGVEVEQETSAPRPKKNPGSAPVVPTSSSEFCSPRPQGSHCFPWSQSLSA